jgi:hypothetical protein
MIKVLPSALKRSWSETALTGAVTVLYDYAELALLRLPHVDRHRIHGRGRRPSRLLDADVRNPLS